MESAIPPHLMMARTCPSRVGSDAEPPYPSFVARHPTSVHQLVTAYLGAQHRSAKGSAALTAALADPDGPRHHDRAVPIDADPDRATDMITVGYWDDPVAFDRWFSRHREPWLAGGGGQGRWLEVIRPRIERYETIFGARSRPEGIAVLAEGFSGPVREHAYWGAMREPACRHGLPERARL